MISAVTIITDMLKVCARDVKDKVPTAHIRLEFPAKSPNHLQCHICENLDFYVLSVSCVSIFLHMYIFILLGRLLRLVCFEQKLVVVNIYEASWPIGLVMLALHSALHHW